MPLPGYLLALTILPPYTHPHSPGFCSSFQNPLTQGYCHMELDKAQDPVFSSESGCLIWSSVSLWYPILIPGQRFQPLVGLMITKASRLLKNDLFYLALSCRSWCLCRWGRAHSTVLRIPTSFSARHSWVKTLSVVSGFPPFHPWRTWRLFYLNVELGPSHCTSSQRRRSSKAGFCPPSRDRWV